MSGDPEAVKEPVKRGPEIARFSLPFPVAKAIKALEFFTEDAPNATVRQYNGQLIIEGPLDTGEADDA